MIRMRTWSAVVVAALLLSICLETPPSMAGAAREMSDERAGNYYNNQFCPMLRSLRTFDRKIWHGRRYVHYAEIRRRLPEVHRISRVSSRAWREWSRDLSNPPADWPDAVAHQADRLAHLNHRAARLRTSQGSASARRWIDLQRTINEIDWGNYAAVLRSRLGLSRNPCT
jgi:hypothetical protein